MPQKALHLPWRQRLGEIVVCSGPHGLDRVRNVRVVGDQDDRRFRLAPADLAQQGHAARTSQLDVGKDQIKVPARQADRDLGRIRDNLDLMAPARDVRRQIVAHAAVTVGDQD